MPAAVRLFPLFLALLAPVLAAEREIVRTFAAPAGTTLRIDTYRGRVTIEEQETETITLTLSVDTGANGATAAHVLDALKFDASAEGRTITVRARNPDETRALWIWEQDRQLALDFKFTVPRRCQVDVTVGRGTITVGNLAGDHRARVREGAITFRRIEGSVDARAEEGNIIVSRCTGALTARTIVGSIRAGTVGGAAQLRTDRGDIDLLVAKAGAVLQAAAGSVSVGFPQRGTGEIRAVADGGDVVARIDPDAACRIEASAAWLGRVESKLPLAIEAGAVGKRRLTAKLNGGGPRLLLQASGGKVRIEKLEFEVELTESAPGSGH